MFNLLKFQPVTRPPFHHFLYICFYIAIETAHMHRQKYISGILLLIGTLFTLALSSCGTRAPRYDYRALAQAAIRLEMDIDKDDNHKLYIESSKWIGVPYRTGGNTRKGVDCSGLTCNIYKTVYRKKLQRSSEKQRKKNCRKVARRNLREGDLVFFHNGRNKRTANHVGIYLKDNKFIHASNAGVIVSSLNEPYYKKYWMQGGRVKGL